MEGIRVAGPHLTRRPSRLRISSEPSISVPFTPTSTPKRLRIRTEPVTIPPPPQVPSAWTWTCHQCHSSFPLGATRRCLHDGHRFCAGATIDRRSGRIRRHKACGSTFDYVGWKTFNTWRDEADRLRLVVDTPTPRSFRQRLFGPRNSSVPEVQMREGSYDDKENLSPVSPKNCERQCSFPSECRWNPRPKKEKVRSNKQATIESYSPKSPKTATVDPGDIEKPAETSPTAAQSSADFRAPVLDFSAFKARLDRANARRKSREGAGRPNLPQLELGLPVLMDVDAISPTGSLPKNKGIHVAITPDGSTSPSAASTDEDVRMTDAWEESSSSDSNSGSDNGEMSAQATLQHVAYAIRKRSRNEKPLAGRAKPANGGANKDEAKLRRQGESDGISKDQTPETDITDLSNLTGEGWSTMIGGDGAPIHPPSLLHDMT